MYTLRYVRIDIIIISTPNISFSDTEPMLIFANRYQLRRMSVNGTVLGTANEENEYVHVLDYDFAKDTIFFVDASKHEIKKMFFNGSNETSVIKREHYAPLVEGLAVDWVNE